MPDIKDQATPEDRLTLVLRATEGHSLQAVRKFVRPGDLVDIGGTGSIVASMSDGDALARLDALDNPASPVHVAVSLLEHVADKIEKGEQPERAKPYRQVADELRVIIGVPKPGVLGVDALSVCRSSSASDRGADLLLAVERAARRVIKRELVCGGLIARAIKEER